MGDLEAGRSAADADELIAWRVRRLITAGMDRASAEEIACDGAYDLHALLDLIDRGCPARLAVRILAPLDDGGSA